MEKNSLQASRVFLTIACMLGMAVSMYNLARVGFQQGVEAGRRQVSSAPAPTASAPSRQVVGVVPMIPATYQRLVLFRSTEMTPRGSEPCMRAAAGCEGRFAAEDILPNPGGATAYVPRRCQEAPDYSTNIDVIVAWNIQDASGHGYHVLHLPNVPNAYSDLRVRENLTLPRCGDTGPAQPGYI